MPSFQEKSPLKSEQLQQSTVCQDFYYHSIISSIGTKNPNPFPIRKKFGFLSFRGDYGTRLLILPWGQNHMVAASSKTGGNHTLCRGQSGHRVLQSYPYMKNPDFFISLGSAFWVLTFSNKNVFNSIIILLTGRICYAIIMKSSQSRPFGR